MRKILSILLLFCAVPSYGQALSSAQYPVTGQATLAQFPAIAAASFLCNPTGSTAAPQACSVPPLIPAAATFTASGCSNGTLVGGANTAALVAAGSFVSGTIGACTVTITLPTATHGWACEGSDLTTPAIFTQTGKSTTTCIITATTVSGDVVTFMAIGY